MGNRHIRHIDERWDVIVAGNTEPLENANDAGDIGYIVFRLIWVLEQECFTWATIVLIPFARMNKWALLGHRYNGPLNGHEMFYGALKRLFWRKYIFFK